LELIIKIAQEIFNLLFTPEGIILLLIIILITFVVGTIITLKTYKYLKEMKSYTNQSYEQAMNDVKESSEKDFRETISKINRNYSNLNDIYTPSKQNIEKLNKQIKDFKNQLDQLSKEFENTKIIKETNIKLEEDLRRLRKILKRKKIIE